MRTISSALAAHLAQPYQTLATCWKVLLTNGTINRFTDHDSDLVISGWTGNDAALNGTYLAASGYSATDIQTTGALNVDNMEVHGMLVSPSITEAELHAGLWDNAKIVIFLCNWADLSSAMGPLYERVGTLGQVTVERGVFRAELRGLMQAYTNTIGQLYSPSCRADLGDARCTVVMAPFTVTGTLTGVNPDNVTLYDTSRAEAGPTGGVAITGVTNANPGVVTLANNNLALANGQAITIAGVLGPTLINTVTLARNPTSAAPYTFQLGIDTTNTTTYPPYSGGGTVTALGADSGYFDYGLITFTSGLNNGLSMEIKSYVPGQLTLALPMPYQPSIGDIYSLKAGCDKAFTTCKAKFSNVNNFRGEPYLPGIDKLVQVGRSQ